MPINILKLILEYIYVPFANVVNKCLFTGQFSSKLKVAKFLPLHKNGDQQCTSNYRPISLISIDSIKITFRKSVISFLLEKCLYIIWLQCSINWITLFVSSFNIEYCYYHLYCFLYICFVTLHMSPMWLC